MLTLVLPALLAAFGCVLTGIAIFAPRPAQPPPAISFAPPSVAIDPRIDRFTNASDDPFAAPSPRGPATRRAEDDAPRRATWPAGVDPRAADCEAGARLALVAALAEIGSSWASSLLGRALADEPDTEVREAIRAALDRA
ncbi:MAG TPA: hypothetical protein VFB22_13215 [Candidatus Baltobacteraceae bacterium]|nr:hypothetical protein [Candidatus Baltobacteraceae bacterium]